MANSSYNYHANFVTDTNCIYRRVNIDCIYLKKIDIAILMTSWS